MPARNDHYVVEGITEYLKPGDPVPERREVDEWYNSKTVTDRLQVFVFLMGLREFQAMPPVDSQGNPNTLSYFQVAGIHGYPKIPWDEETTTKAPDNDWGGYCTHNSILFPTWHRPYMLLFERLIFNHMREWINKSELGPSVQALLIDAIKTWRLPYWDESKEYGDGIYKFPDIAIKQYIEIPSEHLLRGPGYLDSVLNPMAKFSLKDGDNFGMYGVDYTDDDANFGICQATGRWPSATAGEEWINGANNYTNITDAMEEHKWYQWKNEPKKRTLTLANSVFRLLSHQDSSPFAAYECFASTRKYSDPRDKTIRPPLNWLSLEAIHNNLHNWSGGLGHMSEIPVSAFDPLFMLHHCNIDRLFALWQNIWGDGAEHWVKPSYPDHTWDDPSGNWSTEPGSIVDSKTPLAPFRNGSGETDYFTSDDVKDWSTLGYTYTGLPRQWKPKDSGAAEVPIALAAEDNVEGQGISIGLGLQFRREVVQAINKSQGIARNEFLAWAAAKRRERDGDTEDDGDSKKSGDFIKEGDRDGETFNDYVANVTYNKYALNGKSYVIHFILGDASKGDSGKILVGERAEIVDTVYNFAGTDPAACQNCRKQREEGALCVAQVSLNRALLKLLEDTSVDLDTLDEEIVAKFLNDELKWFVTDKMGQIIDIETLLPKFEVHIAVGKVKYFYDATKLTNHGSYRVLSGATDSYPGGWKA
ncbi:hypothetical protein TWF506_001687 [Arthrobotrys conoides]|uniref:tyrosinase n=1 Tax=Arthrobotrys conoides TaxID=74498 RepID=A0AAN8RYC8_9PEZI